MQYHDKTGVSTAPHAAVVNGALARIRNTPCQNEAGQNCIVPKILGNRVYFPYFPDEPEFRNRCVVSTAPRNYLIDDSVFNSELGEIHKITREEFPRAETNRNFAEQIDRDRKTLDKFKDEIFAWRSQLAERVMVSLTRQIEYIFEDDPELGLTQAAPSLDSFSVLLAYLALHPEFKMPSIGFNRDGTFSAIWSGDKKLRVTLDFTSSSTIRWIFVDSRNGIKDAITGAGIVSLAILSGVLDAYKATGWMTA